MQNRKRNTEKKGKAAFPLVAGIVGGLVTGLLLFSLMAVVLCKVDVASNLLTPIATALVSAAIFLSAFIFSFLYREKGILCGCLFGLGCFFVLWLASLIGGQRDFTPLLLIKGAAMVLSGSVGGCIGISARERKRRTR